MTDEADTVPGGEPANTVPEAPSARGTPSSGVPAAQAREPVLFTIGDIGVSRHWVVTPNGTAPLAGTAWIVRDQTRVESKIPGYAIVLAVVFALLCLVGLLFLLIKEKTVTGYVEVTVQGEKLYHVAQIPAASEVQVAQVRQSVHQAQSLAAQLAG